MQKKAKLVCFVTAVTALTIFLIFGVPLLINLSYSLPTIVLPTKWEAVDVLNYYGDLLGASVPVITLFITVCFTLIQIRHEQEYQQTLKMWQEIEKMFDTCLNDIHPYSLQYAFHQIISEGNSTNAYQLIGQIRTYSINARMSVDKLSRCLTQMECDELTKLKEQVVECLDKLSPIADEYYKSCCDVMIAGMVHKFYSNPDHKEECQVNFAESIKRLEICIEEIYRNDYSELIETKSKLFRTTYANISQTAPLLIWGK